MMKTVVFVTLLATCLSLPVDEVSLVPKPDEQAVEPLEIAPPQSVPQEEPVPAEVSPVEGKPEGDLKTDPTFWFGYKYPHYRRSYYTYYPSYYSYYSRPSYYWSSYW